MLCIFLCTLCALLWALGLAQNSTYNDIICDVGSFYDNATDTWIERDNGTVGISVRCPEPVAECVLKCENCDDIDEFWAFPTWLAKSMFWKNYTVEESHQVYVGRWDNKEWGGHYWLDCSTDFESFNFFRWMGLPFDEPPTV